MTITKKVGGALALLSLSLSIQAFAATEMVTPTTVPVVMKTHKTETASSTKKLHMTTKRKMYKKTTVASSTRPTSSLIKKEMDTLKNNKTTTKPKTETTKTTSDTATGPVTAICNDGTESHAANHSGACSDHGGVKTFTQQ